MTTEIKERVSHDLAALPVHTNEALTNVLEGRYDNREVYTNCGILTLAVNPFANVPGLYEPDVRRSFYGVPSHSQRPHVYAVAENAYQALFNGDKRNQTVVITGESGSGKTISCNHSIEYLAARGSSGGDLADKLVHASTVLEAFGNAPTVHNANSSRYAKVVNIHFDLKGALTGASVSTFLLERGRVIDDRPFHIVTLLRKLRETGEKPEGFTKVCTALSDLGIDEEKQERIWSVLEGIDHLIAGNDAPAAECFGLDPQQFHDALTVRTVKAGNVDTVNKPRIGAELKAAQEGLVRALYAWLFEWLVAEVNHALGAADSDGPCISLIDIFGFESFERNTLAQFLINWANEQLQRQLSKDVLERQAEVYMDEGIEMEKPTPQPSCLELIANKPGRKTQTGIACLLDDETRRLGLGLGGTDETFAGNINLECHKLHGYVRSPYTKPNEFVVAHYARQVKYDTRGFLAANSERVDDKLLNCLTSGGEFMQTLVLPRTAGRNSFASVVTSFRKSLDELNNLLTNTRVHYIHCIKPNNEAKSWLFRRDLVSVQVGAAGITQIARFARECGPYRVPHAEMAPYYLVLDTPPNDMQEVVRALSDIAGDPKGVQVGRSFVFFNANALSKIDAALERKVEVLTRLQSAARRFTTQRSFIERKDAMRRKKEEERRAAEALRKQLEAAAAKERAEAEAARAARREERERSMSVGKEKEVPNGNGDAGPLSADTTHTTVNTDTTVATETPGTPVSWTSSITEEESVDDLFHTPPVPTREQLVTAPVAKPDFVSLLVREIINSAGDYETTATAGSLLARIVSWHREREMAAVPDRITTELTSGLRALTERNSIPKIWCALSLSQAVLESGYSAPLEALQAQLFDNLMKCIYVPAEKTTTALLSSHDGQHSNHFMESVMHSLTAFPKQIRKGTAYAMFTREYQLLVQAVLTGIGNETAARALRYLESEKNMREYAGMLNMPLERVLLSMLQTVAEGGTPSSRSQLGSLRSKQTIRHPTKATNAALAAAGFQPVDIRSDLQSTLRTANDQCTLPERILDSLMTVRKFHDWEAQAL